MLRIFLLLSATVAIVSSVVFNANFNKYRNIATCEGRPHTFWIYRKLQAAKACDEVMQSELTAIEKKRILDYHNNLRLTVAAGEERRGSPGPQPAATEMPELEWDDELAELAQRWIQQFNFAYQTVHGEKFEWDDELAELAQRWVQQCNFAYDQCRDVERFKVNQLIAHYDASGGVVSYDVKNLINDWYNDVETINAEIVSNYSLVERQSSYTQIVSAETTKIGCGGIKHRIPNKKRFFLVCNYGPGGNIIGKSVYKTC